MKEQDSFLSVVMRKHGLPPPDCSPSFFRTPIESAVEIRDRKSLHRYVVPMVETVIGRKEYQLSSQRMKAQRGGLRSDVALIAERMAQGFARTNERFSATD